MDRYYNGEHIAINLYDVIEHVYGVSAGELRKVLDVPVGVIGYAKIEELLLKELNNSLISYILR